MSDDPELAIQGDPLELDMARALARLDQLLDKCPAESVRDTYLKDLFGDIAADIRRSAQALARDRRRRRAERADDNNAGCVG